MRHRCLPGDRRCKTAHRGYGLPPGGKKVLHQPMPNSEPKLRTIFDKRTEGRQRRSDRGLARFHRRLAPGRRSRPGLRGRLPPQACDAVDRRPLPGRDEDRRKGCCGDWGRRLHTLRSLQLTDEITAELTTLTEVANRVPQHAGICLDTSGRAQFDAVRLLNRVHTGRRRKIRGQYHLGEKLKRVSSPLGPHGIRF